MSIQIHKLGPGQLSFGEVASAEEFGVRAKATKLVPEVEEGDEITVLSGDIVQDDADVKWSLEGELYDDYTADSLAIWCLEQNGKSLEFTFRPREDQPLSATGTAIIRPIAIGGEVKERNTNEFKFKATDVKISASA